MSAVLSNLQPNSVAPHPEESTVLLEMKGIHKSFPGVRALCGVELTVKRGKVHALIGENGAGKSTLMKILGGIYQPDEGSIRFKGEPLAILDPKYSIRSGSR
jgi:ABC-type sugar transport system ATPase subunit